jgi:shikimate kinase
MVYSDFLAIIAMMMVGQSMAFAPAPVRLVRPVVLKAGGFEWEDPTEQFDQGVDNPFKNPELMDKEDDLKVDPFRLLGPRLNGSNLYFIGMMGCGKTAVGDLVARSKSFVKYIMSFRQYSFS